MVDIATFTQLALSFPGSEEQPHFHRRSFRVGKKIFATLHEKDHRAMIKLPLIEQSVFCAYGDNVFFPVPGAWGKKGATFVELGKARKDMLKDALTVAYDQLVKKPTAAKSSAPASPSAKNPAPASRSSLSKKPPPPKKK